jgi:hypothetical protein
VTFSYTLPITEDRDRLRLRIGDTDSSVPINQRLEDEELDELLSTFGSVAAAAPEAAEALAAKFARLAVDKTAGSLTIGYANGRHQALLSLAKTLRQKMAAYAAPVATGIRQSDRTSAESDGDRRVPGFKTGMLDNPEELADPETV